MSATITAGYAGFEPSIGGGYISNGELLAWLSQVTGNKWDEMRELMMSTDLRHDVMKDLENLRSAYENAGEDKDTSELRQILTELTEKYKGTPYEKVIHDVAQSRLDAISAVDKAYALSEALDKAGYKAAARSAEDKADDLNNNFVSQLDTMEKELERLCNQLGRDDQMTMIRIQELKDNISQAVSLTSNMVRADDEAKSAVIMNIKG